jgi:hypothetical protein
MVQKMRAGKSWRTTVAAVCMSLSVILSNVVAVVDDDPETKIDLPRVMLELGMIAGAVGLAAARDDKVTSEQAGAKPDA